MDPATTEWLLTAMERLVMCGAAISIGVAQWVMRELFHMQDGWYTFPVSVLLAVVVLAVIAGVIKLVNLPINGAPGYNWMWIMLSVGGALPPVAAIIRQFGDNAPAHQFEVTQGVAYVSVGVAAVGVVWAICVGCSHWGGPLRKLGTFLLCLLFVLETYLFGFAAGITAACLLVITFLLLFIGLVLRLAGDSMSSAPSIPHISIPASNSDSDDWSSGEKWYKDQNGEKYHGHSFSGDPDTIERDTLGHHGTFDRRFDGSYEERYTGEKVEIER